MANYLMDVSLPEFNQVPEITMTRDLMAKIGQGNQWLFNDVLADVPGQYKGLAKLKFKGKVVGYGALDSGSELQFRFLSWENDYNKLQKDLWNRFLNAKSKRVSFLSDDSKMKTNSFRFIFGESDFFPGIVIDIFGDYASMQLDRPWFKKIWNLEAWSSLLLKEFPFLKGIYLKAKTKDGEDGQILFGHLPQEIIFLENGIKFKTSLSKAAKTGFFLDQRDNRFMISKVSENKKVANFFSYTGGFSLFAALGRCREVHSIDIAPEAIKVCEEQFALNDFKVKRENICGDAFEWLEKYDKQKNFFDLVIIDPPSFAPNQKSKENAIKAYVKCFSLGAKIVAPNGMIAFSSCSAHVTAADFQTVLQNALALAKRQGQVLYQGGSPLDHPYPLAMPELNYLKFSLLALN